MTINGFIERVVFGRYPLLRHKARKLGEYLIVVVHDPANVRPEYHIVVDDRELRDAARSVIRSDSRGIVCSEADDAVLVIASAQ